MRDSNYHTQTREIGQFTKKSVQNPVQLTPKTPWTTA